MLADSVEASVRSLRNPDEATIRAMVDADHRASDSRTASSTSAI